MGFPLRFLRPEILAYASIEIVRATEPAPVEQVERTIEETERASFHTFLTDPATGPLLDRMTLDNEQADALLELDRENEATWQSDRDGDACGSHCGFCGRCS